MPAVFPALFSRASLQYRNNAPQEGKYHMYQHCGKLLLAGLLALACLISACSFTDGSSGSSSSGLTAALSHEDTPAVAAGGGTANAFNPWMQKTLPNTRELSTDGKRMLPQMGGSASRIEEEAAYRAHWREEIYPVVFGNRQAPHELLVLLDFSNPRSETLWKQVMTASRTLDPSQCKIVVYGLNKENYGTDLMGMAIWISYERKGQAMAYLDYALSRWNAVKAGQKKARGKAIPFTNEYDATVKSTDFPIHYAYLSRLKPAVPASREMDITSYCYDAGSVNTYQAVQICRYYGITALPAVVADGKVLSSPSAEDMIKAVR